MEMQHAKLSPPAEAPRASQPTKAKARGKKPVA
jgi:hypothetical protein